MSGHRSYHGKRQVDYPENGSNKRRNPGEDTYAPGPDDTVYRYLCPSKKVGSILGKGGEIAKQLRADTQAKIRIGESVPGSEERVITIFSSSKETNSIPDTDSQVCPAQDAVFKVFERLISDEASREEESDGSIQVTVRLLIPSDQIGCIIGKGGQIIQGIRSDSGAQVRVLSSDHLPACSIRGDELLQITGEPALVRKALLQVSSRLHDNPSRSQHLLSSNAPQGYSLAAPNAPVVGIAPIIGTYGGYKGDVPGEWPAFFQPRKDDSPPREFVLRLLCPGANIGGVIGKGGGIIRQIRQESGAAIKVDSAGAEDDCIITVSAKEYFEDAISPTIDAAVRLQPRCSEKQESQSGESSYTTRLLVSTSRIGCLIGKGGSIITEMRRNTKANIRILSKENVPKIAAEDEEMVQISGELDTARHALVQVTTRLKANCFEKENALSAFASLPPPPPPIPYQPLPVSAESLKYSSRDGKASSHGYPYSGSYNSSDVPVETYHNYSSSQPAGGSYSGYGGYGSRSGGNGYSSSSAYGKHHGY